MNKHTIEGKVGFFNGDPFVDVYNKNLDHSLNDYLMVLDEDTEVKVTVEIISEQEKQDNRNTVKIIADKIIEINSLHYDLIEQKSEVNYLNALKNSRKRNLKDIYPDIVHENFQFESLDETYLNGVLNKLRDERFDVTDKLREFDDVDTDDYK